MTSYVPRIRSSNHSLQDKTDEGRNGGGGAYTDGITTLDTLDVPNARSLTSNGTHLTLVDADDVTCHEEDNVGLTDATQALVEGEGCQQEYISFKQQESKIWEETVP